MQELIKAKVALGIQLTPTERAYWLLFVATDEEIAQTTDA